jgi:hypothetical protein
MKPARYYVLSGLLVVLGATAAGAHGDVPETVCVAGEGVTGASRGRYGTVWVETGDPVPLALDGRALTGVGGRGWDRPLGQIPECPPATTTTTVPATTLSATSSSLPPYVPTTFDITDTERNVGTHAPSLPETGAWWGLTLMIGVVSVWLGIMLLGYAHARNRDRG